MRRLPTTSSTVSKTLPLESEDTDKIFGCLLFSVVSFRRGRGPPQGATSGQGDHNEFAGSGGDRCKLVPLPVWQADRKRTWADCGRAVAPQLRGAALSCCSSSAVWGPTGLGMPRTSGISPLEVKPPELVRQERSQLERAIVRMAELEKNPVRSERPPIRTPQEATHLDLGVA